MVNEINKPPTNDHLNERLAASNRQLREMQEEHRQLLQEMEALRERATELSRLSAQRHQEQEELLQEAQLKEENNTKTATVNEETENHGKPPSSSPPLSTTSSLLLPAENTCEAITATADNASGSNENPTEDKPADDADSAEYIKQKIAEIAALKAQYKRVQHMVNTTNLIEQHLTTKNSLESSNSNSTNEQQNSQNTPSEPPPLASTLETPTMTSTSPNATAQDPKEELLNAMLGMFTNFSDDLRGQAETLRAERERIKNLKELLLQRRKEDT